MNDKDLYEELKAMTHDRDQWQRYATEWFELAEKWFDMFTAERKKMNNLHYHQQFVTWWRPQGEVERVVE
jgi:hypothetical protein